MAWPFTRRRGIVASAARGSVDQTSAGYRRSENWQDAAFAYYDSLGEIHEAAQFAARPLSKLVLKVEEIDAETGEWADSENTEAQALLDRIKGSGGSRSELLAAYGQLMFLSGECYLVGTITDEEETWEFLSTAELKPVPGEKGAYRRYKYPGSQPQELQEASDDDYEPLPNECVVYRFWRRHPRYSSLADSPMRGVLDICVARGTMISTPQGARRVEDVREGDSVYAWSAEGLIERPVTCARSTGENETMRVVAGRRTIQCTPEHRLLVLRRNHPGKGRVAERGTEWVRAAELERGDALVTVSGIPDHGTDWLLPDGTVGDERIAYLLGQIVGDGHISRFSVQIATFNEALDLELAEIVRSTWGLEPRRKGRGVIAWHSVALVRMFRLLGLVVKAPEKGVPPIVWQMPDDHKRAFLRGYEQSDGHLTPQGWQSHATSSPRLAHELRHLYLELGENVSNIHIQERPEEMFIAGNSKATVGAKALHRFQVYYGSSRKGAIAQVNTETARSAIGGEQFTIATVKSVELAPAIETFDLSVPGPVNFIADGLIAHNCEELLVLTRSVRGEALSRLANAGVFLVPEEATMPGLEAGPDEDPEEDPLISAFTEAARASVKDPAAASSMIPIVVRTSGAEIANWRHITFGNAANNYPEAKLRDEAINRLAIGLDMPVEALTGIGGANHWTGWLLDDQGWRVHVQPLAELLVQNLTATVFRPELGTLGVTDPTMFRVAYDPSSVVVNSDRGRDAKDLHDRGAVSDEALRIAAGFDDEDMPSPEAPNSNPRVILALARAADFGGPATETGIATGATPTPSGDSPADATPLPPNDGEPALNASALDARIEGAAMLAVERCRELAGSKIISKAAGNVKVKPQLEGVPKHLVACALGPDVALSVAGSRTPAQLVAGGAMTFRSTLTTWGIPEECAREMTAMVEAHAAETLFDAQPENLPPGLLSLLVVAA